MDPTNQADRPNPGQASRSCWSSYRQHQREGAHLGVAAFEGVLSGLRRHSNVW